MHEASRPKQAKDEDEEAKPPTPERVARRALALTAVTARAILEQGPANLGKAGSNQGLMGWLRGLTASLRSRSDTCQYLMTWIKNIGIDDEFEPDEWQVLQRPLGRLDEQAQLNSTWRLEGLVVLAWALDRFEIPLHDKLVEFNPLWRSLGLLRRPRQVRSLLKKPMLRSREEIGSLRNRFFALHWRLRNFQINRKVMDFAEFARTCWFGPLDISGLPLVEGDLGLQGKRIDRASSDVFSSAHSSAQERHQAANWLWEGPERYFDASVAT